MFLLTLSVLTAQSNAQVDDQSAREQARTSVRLQLRLKPDQFLAVQRDETLELSLALAVRKRDVFIYRVSQAGDEIREHAIVHHIFTDVDPTYIIAISATDGSAYRIHGFTDSLQEFKKLMKVPGLTIARPEQAEFVAAFYREVNPKNRSIAAISSLLDLKQTAERQCQTVPFDPNERDFEAWWKHAKPLYGGASFKQTVTTNSSGFFVGFFVGWIVLSSAGAGLCGGAPLRAMLEIEKDGGIGKLTFVPLRLQ